MSGCVLPETENHTPASQPTVWHSLSGHMPRAHWLEHLAVSSSTAQDGSASIDGSSKPDVTTRGAGQAEGNLRTAASRAMKS